MRANQRGGSTGLPPAPAPAVWKRINCWPPTLNPGQQAATKRIGPGIPQPLVGRGAAVWRTCGSGARTGDQIAAEGAAKVQKALRKRLARARGPAFSRELHLDEFKR